MKQLKTGDMLHGFILRSISDLEEYKGKGLTFEHIETGMELFHLYNDDEDNLFSFAFKTPVSDDTGVAHILEHSVLSGSRKYPVKDPFMALIKGSMNTFINAMTYPDKTVYPASSPVEKDYFNIMGVYADSVFFPLLKKEVFHQEGHRLEFDENGNLRIVGVVYNEMKGAYSNHDSIAAEWSIRSLFPDTCYANNSGGEPAKIPDLCYEDFLKFHKTYYHPSNCRVFLYGNIPTEKQLKFLQEGFLKIFKRKTINFEIKKQKRWSEKREFETTSALSEGETPEGKSTILVNWLTEDVSDPFRMLTLEIMNEILLGNAGSPLYKAIVESGLGTDVSPVSGLETDLREFVFSVGLRGTDPEKKEDFEVLIEKELQKLFNKGIHKDIVTGALKRIEFRNREIRGGAPAGLRLMDKTLRGWLHGYSPELTLEFSRWMEKVKEAASRDDRFFENFLGEILLKNKHRSVVIVRPAKEHTKKQEEIEAERITAVKSSLTSLERAKIEKENKALKRFQEIPDSPQSLATIPSLSLTDLPADISIINTEQSEEDGIPTFMHDLFTNGIVYVDFGFGVGTLDEHENMYLPLLGKMITASSLPGMSYGEVARLFALYTGGFYSFLESSSVIGERKEIKNSMFFRVKFLKEDLEKAVDLVIKMFLEANIDEETRLKDVINEMRGDFSASIIPSGHSYASLRAGSKINPVFGYEEKWRGLDQFIFLSDLAENLTDEKLNKTGTILRNLRKRIFSKHNVMLNVTAPGEKIKQTLSILLPRLSDLNVHVPAKGRRGLLRNTNTNIESVYIPSPIGFVGLSLKGTFIEERQHAAEILLSHILKTEYLWETVRMKGGAYGASASANGMEGIFAFSSYRDPKIIETVEAYREGLKYFCKHKPSENTVEQAIIAVVGKDVRPLSPGEKSIIGFRRVLYGIHDSLRRDKRRWLLETSPRDIMEAARRLLEQFDNSVLVILAGRESIMAASEKMPELPGKTVNLPQ